MVKGAVLKTARRGTRAWVQILPAPPDVSFIEVRCSHYLPICCYNTVGHTEIHAWGDHVRRQFFRDVAVVVEPRIPWIYPWECQREDYTMLYRF